MYVYYICCKLEINSLSFIVIVIVCTLFVVSRRAEGPGREILQHPPSVHPSVRPSGTFNFRTVTQKRIDVFSQNFAGMCTMSWGCAV